jgi:hypothetical protein
MVAPVYLYYELENFYSNHRDFVKSRLYPQLRGDIHVDSSNNSKCEGARFVKEIFDYDETKYKTFKNETLKADDFANPCGLIAKSYFNDTYELYADDQVRVAVDETMIANNYDRDYVFKRHSDFAKLQWADVENGKIVI